MARSRTPIEVGDEVWVRIPGAGLALRGTVLTVTDSKATVDVADPRGSGRANLEVDVDLLHHRLEGQ
jgi:hypothetical protein